MSGLINRFQKLPQKERNQVITLIGCILLSCYMIVAVLMYDNMFKTENLSNRKQNRIETRIGKFEIPEIKRGSTPKDLDKVNAVLDKQKALLLVYQNKLMPMDTPKPRQQTKLEITYLAQKHHIDIEQLDTTGTELREKKSTLSDKELAALFSQRTAFNITVRSQYFDFINFVEDLSNLPYLNYIKHLEIKQKKGSQDNDGLLDIKFDLQM